MLEQAVYKCVFFITISINNNNGLWHLLEWLIKSIHQIIWFLSDLSHSIANRIWQTWTFISRYNLHNWKRQQLWPNNQLFPRAGWDDLHCIFGIFDQDKMAGNCLYCPGLRVYIGGHTNKSWDILAMDWSTKVDGIWMPNIFLCPFSTIGYPTVRDCGSEHKTIFDIFVTWLLTTAYKLYSKYFWMQHI